VPTARPSETLIALLAMVLIALICRWVFKPTHTGVRRTEPAPGDYGLLVPVASARTQADAVMLRDLLITEGVRASITPEHEVLVFAKDAERARALVAS
jgi:hypothetical protein